MQLDLLALPHAAFESRGRTLRISSSLTPCGLTDQGLAIRRDRHITGKCLAAETDALCARNNYRPPAA